MPRDSLQVDRIVKIMLPGSNVPPPAPTFGSRQSQTARDDYQAFQARRAALRSELAAMSDEDFARRFDLANKIDGQRRAHEESKHFYNRPEATINVTFVASMPYWTPDEAVAAAFGKNPEVVTWEICKTCTKIYPFCAEFERRRDQVRRAVETGQLPLRIPPDSFVTWAIPRGFPLHPELQTAVVKLSQNLSSPAPGPTHQPEVKTADSNRDGKSIPILPGLKWSDVFITMQGENRLLVKLPGFERSFAFDALNFGDGRGDHSRPSKKWQTLRLLAGGNGAIDADAWRRLSPKDGDNLKARISDLRKHLRSEFHVADDPIRYHQKAYAALFHIAMSDELTRSLLSEADHDDDGEDYEDEMQNR